MYLRVSASIFSNELETVDRFYSKQKLNQAFFELKELYIYVNSARDLPDFNSKWRDTDTLVRFSCVNVESVFNKRQKWTDIDKLVSSIFLDVESDF